MAQQTISYLNTASKSKTAMIEELLQMTEQADFLLTENDYEKLRQAFINAETQMLNAKRLVRLYPNWVAGKKQ